MPSAGPGPGGKGRVGGWEGTEAPGCLRLLPSLGLMCSRKIPDSFLCVCVSVQMEWCFECAAGEPLKGTLWRRLL